MDISRLFRDRNYQAAATAEQFHQDMAELAGLWAMGRPRQYGFLAASVLWLLGSLAVLFGIANSTSESEMPLRLGIPLLVCVAVEVYFVRQMLRWVSIGGQANSAVALRWVRSLRLAQGAIVQVWFPVRGIPAPLEVKLETTLQSGVVVALRLHWHFVVSQQGNRRKTTEFLATELALRFPPGRVPGVEALGPTLAGHLRLVDGFAPERAAAGPGVMEVRTRLPASLLSPDALVRGGRYVLDLVEAAHALLGTGIPAFDRARADEPLVRVVAAPQLPRRSAGPALALAGVMALVGVVAVGFGVVSLQNARSLRGDYDVHEQRYHALELESERIRTSPLPYTNAEAFARAQRERQAQREALDAQVVEERSMAWDLDARMRKGELDLRRGMALGGVALLVAVVSGIVGALRRRRPQPAQGATFA